MDIKKIVLQIEEILEQEVKKQGNNIRDYELCLRVYEPLNSLEIGFYKNSGLLFALGHITQDGRCYFLNNDERHENWETWKRYGFKVAEQTPIAWKGLEWFLSSLQTIHVGEEKSHRWFYDFELRYANDNVCTDKDFLKKDSGGKIHLY